MEIGMVESKWPKHLWTPLFFLFAGMITAFVYAAFATYIYLNEFVVDLPYPSDDLQFSISAISQMTIPFFLIGLALLLFAGKNALVRSMNTFKIAFLGGAVMVTIGGLINVFVMNYYFRDQRWIEHIDLVNHLSFLGVILYQIGFVICVIAAIFIIRSLLGKVAASRAG